MHRGQEQWQVNPLSVMLSYVNCSVPKLSCKDWVLWVPRQMQLWTEIILGVRDHVWSLTRKGEQTAEATQLWPTPSLNSTAPCEATFQSSPILCWDEQVSEEKDNPALDELSGVNHRVISDRKQAVRRSRLLLSPQDREEQCGCFPLLASLSEILAFYDTGHTWMYRYPQRHVDTCKDIKAHTHSLCLFFLPCRKPWRRLICEHVKH